MPAIRRGVKEDLVSIARIQSASPEATRWNVEDYLVYDLWVAESDGAVTGFLVSRSLGFGEGELLNMAVAPERRRAGVGKSLLRAFTREFPAGAYLEVRESNAVALNLYKSMGFKELNRRPKYYQSPPESAIVMKFHSC
jgi:[ribosomal protein S18]-alanine N-acetyltransferase